MKENPFYFEDIFRRPFSPTNAKTVITELRCFVGKHEEKKEAPKIIRIHEPHKRKRIIKQSKAISVISAMLK